MNLTERTVHTRGILALLNNSNEIKFTVLAKLWSMPNDIASFIMLNHCTVNFLKGRPQWCLIQMEKVTSFVTASLMLHEFRLFGNACYAEMILDRKIHSDKQTFSARLLGHSDRPPNHHGEQTFSFFLNHAFS